MMRTEFVALQPMILCRVIGQGDGYWSKRVKRSDGLLVSMALALGVFLLVRHAIPAENTPVKGSSYQVVVGCPERHVWSQMLANRLPPDLRAFALSQQLRVHIWKNSSSASSSFVGEVVSSYSEGLGACPIEGSSCASGLALSLYFKSTSFFCQLWK